MPSAACSKLYRRMKPIQIPNVIAALDRDHANIARLLELLESEILAIEVGKTPDYSLLQDIMRYLNEYPDRFHHPQENLIFAQLVKRDPDTRDAVDRLVAEHIDISVAGQNFNILIRTSNVDSVSVRERLRISGLAYIRALREHMLKEEKNMFPLAMAILTKEDWQIIEKRIDAIDDPLFDTEIAEGYERLYRLITDRTASGAITGDID